MEEDSKNEILTQMYRERGNNADKDLLKKEKEITLRLEKKLRKICEGKQSEIDNILVDIYELCNIDSEAYYKKGIADGVKLRSEIQKYSF